jgi:hypothetical protein
VNDATLSTLAVVAASASALAAWTSASLARQTARRAHFPYVWPDVRINYRDEILEVSARLHNDGPGLAQDVVAARLEPPDDEHPWAVFDRTPTIRAMRGGEANPRDEKAALGLGAHTHGDDIFSVVVRWTDTAGQRWELVAPQDPKALTRPPRALRRRRWQRWRDPADW